MPRALPEALKIFAGFFTAPLMRTECVAREVLAIESEFREAVRSDATRLDELLARARTAQECPEA